MDIEKVFSKNPLLAHLKKEEYASVFDIFESSPMKVGGLDLVYDRSPNFEELLDCQSEHHYTFVVRREERIRALGSVSWGPRFVQHHQEATTKKLNVSYAGDFRALFEREAAVAWRRFYSDLMDVIFTSSEFGPSKYLLTAVLKDNEIALRNIVQHGRKQIKFTYDLLKEIQMVNFFFRKPWAFRRAPADWVVKRPVATEEKPWREWLASQHQQMNFGYDFSEAPGNEWDRRKTVWPEWNFRNFLSVYNEHEQRVLMTMPWAPTAAKRMRVTSGTFGAKALYKAFRWVGFNSPTVGETFKTLYLTHFCFSKESTIEERRNGLLALLEYLRSQRVFERYNMVSFADQWNLVDGPEFAAYFVQKTGVNLYLVRRPEDEPTLFSEADIDFEMALV